MAKINLNKMVIGMLTKAALATPFAIVISVFINAISNGIGSISSSIMSPVAVGLIFAAFFLAIAIAIHRGKENFFETLPTLLLVLGLSALVSGFIGFEFLVENNTSGLAIGFGVVFLAEEAAAKVLGKRK